MPEDHPLPEGYADREAKRMRADRLQAEADRCEWLRKWDEERAKPIGQRQFFSFGEIADRLDPAIRERVRRELAEWVQTQQFRAGEVVTLSSNPPDFRPLGLPLPPAGGGIILLPDAEAMALRRDACRRYLEARTGLPGAASLLRNWFSAEATVPPLRGKALDDALDRWALRRWGKNLLQLPGRDELLSLARQDNPEFSRVTQQDIRALRRRIAPDEIKRGGATTHRRQAIDVPGKTTW
jgi:hypothetical protein